MIYLIYLPEDAIFKLSTSNNFPIGQPFIIVKAGSNEGELALAIKVHNVIVNI